MCSCCHAFICSVRSTFLPNSKGWGPNDGEQQGTHLLDGVVKFDLVWSDV